MKSNYSRGGGEGAEAPRADGGVGSKGRGGGREEEGGRENRGER